jgi:hypothetical protein
MYSIASKVTLAAVTPRIDQTEDEPNQTNKCTRVLKMCAKQKPAVLVYASRVNLQYLTQAQTIEPWPKNPNYEWGHPPYDVVSSKSCAANNYCRSTTKGNTSDIEKGRDPIFALRAWLEGRKAIYLTGLFEVKYKYTLSA